MSEINFNAEQVAPDTGITPVPRGRYKVVIVESELKPTKNGAGEIIALSHQVIDGPCRGKTIKSNLNWKNQNATAQNIGHAQLSAICHSVGVLHPQNTQQLHNIPLCLEVDVTDDGKYNEVKAYLHLDMASQEMPPAPQPKMIAGPVGMLGGAPAPAPMPYTPPPQQYAPPQQQMPTGQPPAFQQAAAPQPQYQAPAGFPAPNAGQSMPPQTMPSGVATSHSEPKQAYVQPVTPAPTAQTPPWIAAQQAAQQQAQG